MLVCVLQVGNIGMFCVGCVWWLSELIGQICDVVSICDVNWLFLIYLWNNVFDVIVNYIIGWLEMVVQCFLIDIVLVYFDVVDEVLVSFMVFGSIDLLFVLVVCLCLIGLCLEQILVNLVMLVCMVFGLWCQYGCFWIILQVIGCGWW